MTKQLKLYNGRAICIDRKFDTAFIAAYSRADARRIVLEYKGRSISDTEIKEYWSEGSWGNSMDHIVPERGLWLMKDHEEAVRVVPHGAPSLAKRPERIEVDRKLFEELCKDQRLLGHLEAAGIDNCDAFAYGYQAFQKAEALRDDT